MPKLDQQITNHLVLEGKPPYLVFFSKFFHIVTSKRVCTVQ